MNVLISLSSFIKGDFDLTSTSAYTTILCSSVRKVFDTMRFTKSYLCFVDAKSGFNMNIRLGA